MNIQIKSGKTRLSAINIVNEEGRLGMNGQEHYLLKFYPNKQPKLAKQQLDLALKTKSKKNLKNILLLPNPNSKKEAITRSIW